MRPAKSGAKGPAINVAAASGRRPAQLRTPYPAPTSTTTNAATSHRRRSRNAATVTFTPSTSSAPASPTNVCPKVEEQKASVPGRTLRPAAFRTPSSIPFDRLFLPDAEVHLLPVFVRPQLLCGALQHDA